MCRGVSHTPITTADKPKPFPISPNISAKRCRGVSHTPFMAAGRPKQFPFHKTFQRKGVGAYRIRPPWRQEYINHWSGLAIFFACSPTSGRMRYAPTLVRLIVGRGGDFRCAFAHVRAYAIRPYTCSLNRWAGRRFSLRVRSRQGVCDTPLHLFA